MPGALHLPFYYSRKQLVQGMPQKKHSTDAGWIALCLANIILRKGQINLRLLTLSLFVMWLRTSYLTSLRFSFHACKSTHSMGYYKVSRKYCLKYQAQFVIQRKYSRNESCYHSNDDTGDVDDVSLILASGRYNERAMKQINNNELGRGDTFKKSFFLLNIKYQFCTILVKKS